MSRALFKRLSIMAIALIIVFGALFGGRHLMVRWFIQSKMQKKPQPIAVAAVQVTQESWQPSISVPGTLVAVNGIELSAEVAGVVSRIYFHSGQMVKAGQLLVQLDDAVDQQELKNLKAQMSLNRSNYQRLRKVIHVEAVSKQDLETALSTYQQSVALVKKEEELISQKAIRAPFSGKLGIRKVNIGQYVAPGAEMVSLQSLHPLLVRSYLPEQDLHQIHLGQDMEISIEGLKSKKFKGKVSAIGSKVDVNTRNIEIQGIMPNDSGELLPGGFVQVKLMLAMNHKVTAIPQTAITYSLYGDSVFLLKKKESAEQSADKVIYTVSSVPVVVGKRRQVMVSITKGLKIGDWVVDGGQMRLHPGAEVIIQPFTSNET
jgi:membrane fusion protein, multidrug efflux system